MVNKPRNIGTAAETAVVRWLQNNGWPCAERRALKGSLDCGDITGTPMLCWEVKAGQAAKTASDRQVAKWLAETETERVNAKADLGILVMARAGYGPVNAGQWWAVVPMLFIASLLDGRTYGGLMTGKSVLDLPNVAEWMRVPYRTQLAGLVLMLRAAGYGDAIYEELAS